MPDARHAADTTALPAPVPPVTDAPAARARPPAPAGGPAPAWTLEVIYEDEDVVMEWSVRTPAAETVAVTFDPILVDASRPAYAASFLHKAGIDTLCVRKKSEHFYQPLTRECFEQAARPVLANYRRRLAYGSSLGAYAVLYFCAHGFETVISSSPRVSAHPRFGRPHWQERAPFRHEFFDPHHPATSGAVVFYDPHDAMDRRFVDDELRPAWPQARFVAVPYAGHPANQFLSEIGYISPFVHAIVSGRQPPTLDRRGAKARSFTYRHMLAAACLRHGKARWAEQLCREALAMKSDLVDVKLTLGQALLRLGRLDEAEPPLLEFQHRYPQDGDARQALRALARERADRQRKRVMPFASTHLRRLRLKARSASMAWRSRLALATLWLTSRMSVSVSRGDIEWCYRQLLGREPESRRALLAHRRCREFEQLVRAFVSSPEFADRVARLQVEFDLERLVGMAAMLRRVLPAAGHVVDVRSAGAGEPAACAWIGAAQVTAEADQTDFGLEDHVACEGAPRFDVGLSTEPVELASADGQRVLQTLAILLKPDGHVLLATHALHGDARHDGARGPTGIDGLLQAHGFKLIENRTLASDGGTRLTLARKF